MPGSRVARAMWSVAAQGIASASNFGVQFGLVVTMSAPRFGAMVVGFAVFYLALALGRAWVGDPLVAIADSAAEVDLLWPTARSRLTGLGLASMAAVLGWSTVADDVVVELAILAVATPFLLQQDGHRYRAWAVGRFPRVVGLDMAWLLTSCLVVGIVALASSPSAVDGRLVLVAWAGGGVVSWQLARVIADRRSPAADPSTPGPAVTAEDGARSRRFADSLAAQQAILAVDANGVPVAVATVADATVTAGIRAVVLPFAPVTSILSGLRVLILPLLRASVRRGHPRTTMVKVAALFTGVAVVISLLTLGGLAVIPGPWLGESGQLVRTWFPLGAVIVASRMIGLPFADLMALSAEPAAVARIRLATSGIDWAATLLGAVAFGIHGAIGGRAIAGALSLVVWASLTSLRVQNAPAETPERSVAPWSTTLGSGEASR